ncbi:MAG: CRISPR-associated endonuclease Cas2 [Patescibacteria group bacterium]
MQGRLKRGEVYKNVLRILGAVGIASVAILAPNALQAISMLQGGGRKRSLYYLTSVLGRMESKGFIVFRGKDGKRFVRITEKGKRELDRYRLRQKSLEKKRWDRKWRIVIFDIKEYKRGTRAKIRAELKNFGFVILQQSVWVYPHECEEIIGLLKADYFIGKEVLYIIAEKIENDAWLRKEFRL